MQKKICICSSANTVHSPAEWKLGDKVELVKSCIVPNCIDCPECGLSYRCRYDRLTATQMPFSDCAPQMHFPFLFSRFLAICAPAIFSCSQGLSLFFLNLHLLSSPFQLFSGPPPSTWTTLHLFSKPLFLEENKIHEIWMTSKPYSGAFSCFSVHYCCSDSV